MFFSMDTMRVHWMEKICRKIHDITLCRDISYVDIFGDININLVDTRLKSRIKICQFI